MLRLRLMCYVTVCKMHLSCIINMDETTAKFLGLGQRGWVKPKQDRRVRFIGADDKRNITISTVVTMTGTFMAQLIVDNATKRVVQDLPEHEKISYTFSDSHECTESTCQELIEWLGAWVRKQGFLHWVLLWDCASVHQKASLMEWIRTAHVLFIPGGYTAELQPADISIQQSFKHISKQQAMQFFAESVCWEDAVLDLRRGGEKHEHHNESLAPPLLDIRRGTKACGESHSRAPRWHTLRRWNKRSHRRKRTSSSMTTTTMTMLRIPESTGTALAEASTAVAEASTAVAEAAEPFPTVTAQVARAERFLRVRQAIHQSHELFSGRCRTEGVPASCR